jgi:acyl-CoA synthetase (AMP-forming)/AMP-acid ligase II
VSEPDLLTALAQAQGDKTAVIEDVPGGGQRRWSFSELEANAARLGRVLLEHGVQSGDKVIWCGQNSPWIVAMINAARKLGVVAVPLNYRLAPEEAAYVVDNSDAVAVFCDAEFSDTFTAIRSDIPKVRHVLVFDGEPAAGQVGADALLEQADASTLETGVTPGQAGTMIYTSGTTGKPKGAVRFGAGDPAQTQRMIAFYGITPDDVYLTTGPLYHSGPSGFMAVGQALGQTVVLQRKFDAEDWLRLVHSYRVTSTFSAPAPIRLVCNLPEDVLARYDTSSMRVMIANAAPWSYALKLMYLERFPEDSLFEVYGSTELGVNTILRPEFQRSKKGSCGQPAPGVEIRLFDEDGAVVTEPRREGELFVRSASVFSTYHKAQEKFEADRRDGWQTVGDIAYFDEEGFYYICDRKKDMIISGGVNIYPAEIEATLEHHPDVVDVAVFGIPNEEWGEQVHAEIVCRPGAALTEAQVSAYAREHLAGYKVPAPSSSSTRSRGPAPARFSSGRCASPTGGDTPRGWCEAARGPDRAAPPFPRAAGAAAAPRPVLADLPVPHTAAGLVRGPAGPRGRGPFPDGAGAHGAVAGHRDAAALAVALAAGGRCARVPHDGYRYRTRVPGPRATLRRHRGLPLRQRGSSPGCPAASARRSRPSRRPSRSVGSRCWNGAPGKATSVVCSPGGTGCR